MSQKLIEKARVYEATWAGGWSGLDDLFASAKKLGTLVVNLADALEQANAGKDAALVKVAELTKERDQALKSADALARDIGQALAVMTLEDGESIVEPRYSPIVSAMMDMREKVAELEARLAELDPPWSDEPPTVPGVYQMARPGQSVCEVRVYPMTSKDGELGAEDMTGRVYYGRTGKMGTLGYRWRPAPKTRDPWKEGE